MQETPVRFLVREDPLEKGKATHSNTNFPAGSDSKVSAYNVGDPGSVPGLGRSPWEGNGKPLKVFLPGKSHGWRSLVGYSPWDHKESDTTERLHFAFLKTETIQKAKILPFIENYCSILDMKAY